MEFLQRCVDNPAFLLDKTEEKLYSNDKSLNHRNIGTQAILSQLKPHNDHTESLFGANDWLDRILPNMAQATKSAMIEFTYNKTLEWLKCQGKEQKRTMIEMAQKRRMIIGEEAKQEASQLMAKKVEQRMQLVQKGRKRAEAAIKALETETLISTVSRKERMLFQFYVFLDKIKERELKYLIKRQVDLRSKVYKQKGVRILFTEKGNPKSKHPVEPNVPLHQQLYVLFEKPSQLVGCELRHRFEDGDVVRWRDY